MALRPVRLRAADQDGSVSIIVGLMMVFFLSLLATVIDLGQLSNARIVLATATDAALTDAGTLLSQGGCEKFDEARTLATSRLVEHSATATLDTFEVTYGAVTVTSELECTLAALQDQKVGRLDLSATDTRDFVFAGFFSSSSGKTGAASAGEWGYVKGFRGSVRPLSLCAKNAAYLDYLQYQTDREAYLLYLEDPVAYAVANPTAPIAPAPDPTLLDPFDIEIDAYQDSPCNVPDPPYTVNSDSSKAPEFGEFVIVDYGGDPAPASKQTLRDWVTYGADDNLFVDDPATAGTDEAYCPGEDPDYLGACEGVEQWQSLDQVSDFLPVLGKTFTIMIHELPLCDNGIKTPLEYGHCNDPGQRGHRSYDVAGFVRVRVLCLRESAATDTGTIHYADDLTYADCQDLDWQTNDGNPGDDVMVRLQFQLDTTVRNSQLSTDDAFDNGFVGFRLCKVEDSDTCAL